MLKSLLNKRFNSSNAFKYQVPTYNRPSEIIITSGKGVYLHDSINNKKYLDFTAGIAVTALGHNDAQVAKIISDQVQPGVGLIHSSNLYYNKPALDLGIKIVGKTVGSGGMHDAQQVFFATPEQRPTRPPSSSASSTRKASCRGTMSSTDSWP